jgi:hypothetical protein
MGMFMAFSGRAPNLASRILLGLLNHDRGALRFRCAAGRHSVAELDETWFAVCAAFRLAAFSAMLVSSEAISLVSRLSWSVILMSSRPLMGFPPTPGNK